MAANVLKTSRTGEDKEEVERNKNKRRGQRRRTKEKVAASKSGQRGKPK